LSGKSNNRRLLANTDVARRKTAFYSDAMKPRRSNAGRLMHRSLINCSIGVALVATFVLAKPFWLKEQSRGPQVGCSSREPCTEMKLPSEIAKGSTSEIHTSDHNFSLINLGYEVSAFWRNQPTSTSRIIIWRSATGKKPWTAVLDLPASALPSTGTPAYMSLPTQTGPTYYRLEMISSSGTVLKRYGPMLLPEFKYARQLH